MKKLDFRNHDALICSMLTKRGKYMYRANRERRKEWRRAVANITRLAGKHFVNMQRKYVFAMQDIDECRTLHELKRWYKEIGMNGNHPLIKNAKERIKKSRGVWTN